MPDSDWDEMLAAATGEVLETMFFTGIYGAAPIGESSAGPHTAARLSFEGTPSGVLTLSVAAPAARALATNFLASEDDEPLTDAQLGSVVCELTNMICGALLSRVKSEQHFRLSSPDVLLPESGPYPSGPPSQSLDLGDGAMEIWLELEPHAH